ncbi:hypothetical protein DRO56_00470 [Candidatus Bathyarchaeota archaeon]|nr:MAG: hypothetical protein DRO56_00470 [Candidatus Bathyarchaeota archaeon]
MSGKVVEGNTYLDRVEQEFRGLIIPRYKFRRFFEEETRIFFDCDDDDPMGCLKEILERRDLKEFVVLLLTKEKEGGGLKVLDISYRNLGTETLRHFITRYQSQLEPTVKMSLMAGGLEYLALIGYSYEE